MFAERLSEETLPLDEFGHGSADGIALFFDRFHGTIYGMAMFILEDRSQAEEVTKEVFLTFIERAPCYLGTANIASRVSRICALACLGRLGTRGNAEKGVPMDETLPCFTDDGKHSGPVDDWSGDVRNDPADRKLGELIRKYIVRMPENCRVVFALREMAGLSAEETANILGTSVRMVKRDLHRVRLQVREQLGRHLAFS